MSVTLLRMSSGANIRTHALVFGRVQGVFYRASAQSEADRLGLAGWVRNRTSGTVELVAEGPGDAVAALLAWCRTGPPAARVERVEHTESEPVGLSGGFDVRPTA